MSQCILEWISAVIRQFRRREIEIDDLQGQLVQLGDALDRTYASVSSRIRKADFDLESVRFLIDSKDQFREAMIALTDLEAEIRNRAGVESGQVMHGGVPGESARNASGS